jgi:DNA-binding MarR family transcriptional regulator
MDSDRPLLSYLIGRLDRAIRNGLNEVLAPYELSIPQFTPLSVLKRRPGLSNAQLARRALILPQSMIQVITGLEARGLVQRAPSRRTSGSSKPTSPTRVTACSIRPNMRRTSSKRN